MASLCPKCGRPFGFLDRLTQPTMCKACDAVHGVETPLASFDDELKERGFRSESDIDPSRRYATLLGIARKNMVAGSIVFFGTIGVTVVSLLWFTIRPTAGLLILGGGLYGFQQLTSGFFQYRSMKRRRRKEAEPGATDNPDGAQR